jgi:hypothetical protein
MCFTNDEGDWSASIVERSCIRKTSAARCFECGRTIEAGEWRSEEYCQEHEECQICQDESSDQFDDRVNCDTCIHDFGETFAASTCRECSLLLAAVYDLERIEGCPEDARQPMPGSLGDEMGYDDEGRYARHAIALFPELATHVFCAGQPC